MLRAEIAADDDDIDSGGVDGASEVGWRDGGGVKPVVAPDGAGEEVPVGWPGGLRHENGWFYRIFERQWTTSRIDSRGELLNFVIWRPTECPLWTEPIDLGGDYLGHSHIEYISLVIGSFISTFNR
jgi:hypothetical protein